MQNPDAIVIGAGIVGASAALSLTNAGLKVLVIDRGAVSSGTTGAGEGNILVSDKDPGPNSLSRFDLEICGLRCRTTLATHSS